VVKTDSLTEIKAALEEIGKLVALIDCSNKDNLLLLPLFLAQQKRAAAALARMEPVEEAAKGADSANLEERIAARIRDLKERP
jgi:hypothetical protein